MTSVESSQVPGYAPSAFNDYLYERFANWGAPMSLRAERNG